MLSQDSILKTGNRVHPCRFAHECYPFRRRGSHLEKKTDFWDLWKRPDCGDARRSTLITDGPYTVVPQPYLQKVGAFFKKTLK